MTSPANSPQPLFEWFVPNKILGAHLKAYTSVSSTMDVAWSLDPQEFNHGTAIMASTQKQGRGRFNRVWVGEAGKSLHLSVLLKPTAYLASYLSVFASLAVLSSIEALTNSTCSIKWPNDINLNGKKVAGILVESKIQLPSLLLAVVGIGLNLNLNFEKHPDLRHSASNLEKETGHLITVDEAVSSVLSEFDKIYCQASSGKDFVPIWSNYLQDIGKNIVVHNQASKEMGIFEGVDNQGFLILRREDGTKVTFSGGEVSILP